MQAVCFADAKMQMVAEYYAQQFNKRSPPDAKVAFVVSQVGASRHASRCSAPIPFLCRF